MVKHTKHLYMYVHIQCSYIRVKTGEKSVDTTDAP
jgi:hypothetical protein